MAGIAAKLARPNILELQPYRCARDDYSDGVLLDANENAFGPTSLPTKNLDPYDNSNTLERYPDPYQSDLKELFCRERGNDLKPSNVFVGVGSDEAIDLLMRIFCTPGAGTGGDNILITPPTYGMYKVCAKVNDVEIVSAPLTPDFDLDIPTVSFCICSTVSSIKTLSAEAVQKLSNVQPTNLGQASRISGVSPSDISNLMIYLEKNCIYVVLFMISLLIFMKQKKQPKEMLSLK